MAEETIEKAMTLLAIVFGILVMKSCQALPHRKHPQGWYQRKREHVLSDSLDASTISLFQILRPLRDLKEVGQLQSSTWPQLYTVGIRPVTGMERVQKRASIIRVEVK